MATNFRFNNGGTITDFSDVFIRRDIFSKGGLFTWGSNGSGQLGASNLGSQDQSSPVQTIAGGASWKQVSGTGYYGGNMAGIKTDGTLWVWGSYLVSGGVAVSSPIQTAASGSNWKQVSTSNDVAGAIKADGTLWMWGRNNEGSVGNNSTTNQYSPIQTIAGGAYWKQVSADSVVGAIKTDGTLWMWGDNSYGQLGDNTRTLRSSPVQTVSGGTNWKQVSTSYNYVGAIKTDGTLWMWGYGGNGTLGDGGNGFSGSRSIPVQTVSGGTNWKQVSVGSGSEVAAIKTDGTLWMWGSNGTGQLGDGTIVPKSSPVQTVSGGTNWKQVSTSYATAAIKTDGTLWTWGDNNRGQLGDGTRNYKSSPIQTLAGGTNWKQVTMSGYAGAITDIFGDGSAPTNIPGGPSPQFDSVGIIYGQAYSPTQSATGGFNLASNGTINYYDMNMDGGPTAYLASTGTGKGANYEYRVTVNSVDFGFYVISWGGGNVYGPTFSGPVTYPWTNLSLSRDIVIQSTGGSGQNVSMYGTLEIRSTSGGETISRSFQCQAASDGG